MPPLIPPQALYTRASSTCALADTRGRGPLDRVGFDLHEVGVSRLLGNQRDQVVVKWWCARVDVCDARITVGDVLML